jgi:hypothetical protein
MSFAGKWIELEIITLSEVSQVQKDKGCMLSLTCGRQIPKINVYTNINMIVYTHTHTHTHIYVNMTAIVGLSEVTGGRRERKREL